MTEDKDEEKTDYKNNDSGVFGGAACVVRSKSIILQTLELGIAETGSSIFENMLHIVQEGGRLAEHYSFEESDMALEIAENPFDTLRLLGSKYYECDFKACTKLFGFDYEAYAGKKVDLGSYEGFSVSFDATEENVKFSMENDELRNTYQLLGTTPLQIFSVESTGTAKDTLSLKEIECSFMMGMSYGDILSAAGVDILNPKENVYYLVDSDLGKFGCIQWEKDGYRTLCVFLLGSRKLCLQFGFEDDSLSCVRYSCGIPDNLRSKVINWLGGFV